MTSKDTSKPSTTIEAQVDKFLARTCEHKGCKLAVCNHARNNLLKAIEAEKLKGQIEVLKWLDDEYQTTGQDLDNEMPGYTQVCVPCTPIWERLQSLQQQLDSLEEEK